MKEAKEPTQTTPAGAEIPVPTRGDVLRDLLKVATPPVEPDESDARGSSAEEE